MCHCFSSLKAKRLYVVYLVVKKSGDVLSASCTCSAEKGEVCNHIAALMFYLEDFMRQEHSASHDLSIHPQLNIFTNGTP